MIARIAIGDTSTTFEVDDGTLTVACGPVSLRARHFTADPPLPHELTNAIGEMQDHLDDALRELPDLALASTVELRGETPRAVAAIEHGAPIQAGTFELVRDAAEDVFRTVATEVVADRARNPGLPAELVDVIVGGCCAIVALMRGLQLDVTTVVFDAAEVRP